MSALGTLLPPFGTLAGEAARALLVALGIGLVLLAAEFWHRRYAPPAEWTRKLAHFGGGVAAAFLPWLFAHHWTVLALVLPAAVVLATGRGKALLPSVTSVERPSRGEMWFPIGVYLLFALAHTRPVFYVIALSSLAVSDTVAALLGRVYGRVRFRVGGSRKSIEGSAVFMIATFLAVHLALLLATPIGRLESALIAAQIALLAACFEAVSAHGSDNLFVPLGTYYLLLKMTSKPAEIVAIQLLAQVAILVLMLVIARRTRLVNLSGAIAAHLVLYAAFGLGGPSWGAAPAGALAAFVVLDRRHGGAHGVPGGRYQVPAIYYVSVVAVLVLFADNSFATLLPLHPQLRFGHPFYPLFVGALAAPLAILAFEMRQRSPALRRRPRHLRAGAALLIGGVAVLLPGLAVLGRRVTLEATTIALLVCIAGFAFYAALRGRVRAADPVRGNLRLQALCGLAAVIAVLPLHFAWAGIRVWRP